MAEDDDRRALSSSKPILEWPPKVGARIHLNSGWPHTSWTAEVRAVVDDDVLVLRKTRAGRTWWDLLDRIGFEVFGRREGGLRGGPLPRALVGKIRR